MSKTTTRKRRTPEEIVAQKEQELAAAKERVRAQVKKQVAGAHRRFLHHDNKVTELTNKIEELRDKCIAHEEIRDIEKDHLDRLKQDNPWLTEEEGNDE